MADVKDIQDEIKTQLAEGKAEIAWLVAIDEREFDHPVEVIESIGRLRLTSLVWERSS